jgi:hypothetical protein
LNRLRGAHRDVPGTRPERPRERAGSGRGPAVPAHSGSGRSCGSDGTSAPALAATGAPLGTATALGAGLLTAGLIALLGARRRPRT